MAPCVWWGRLYVDNRNMDFVVDMMAKQIYDWTSIIHGDVLATWCLASALCNGRVNCLLPSGLIAMIRGTGTTGHSQWDIFKFQVLILALYLYIKESSTCTDALISAEKQGTGCFPFYSVGTFGRRRLRSSESTQFYNGPIFRLFGR